MFVIVISLRMGLKLTLPPFAEFTGRLWPIYDDDHRSASRS
jgi:hypothetical protein